MRERLIRMAFIFGPFISLTACSSGGTSSSSCGGSSAAIVANSETAQTPVTTPYRVPLSGCTLTDYSMSTTVGATSGMQLLVDSGSTTLAVVSTGCSNCTSITPVYQPGANAQSSCTTTQALYGDNSGWVGAIYNDTVQVSTLPSGVVSLAAITSQSGGFFTSGDCSFGNSGNAYQGIIGLAGSQIALTGTAGYLDALNAQQSFPGLFATQLCMSGGNIWFGNYDSAYTTASPVYTPITQAGGFFSVGLSDFIMTNTTSPFAATDLGLTTNSFPNGAIVDTGTSIGIFPSAVYNAIVADVANNTTLQGYMNTTGSPNTTANSAGVTAFFSEGDCFTTSASEATIDAALPTMTMQFPSTTSGTISVVLPASRSYLDLHVVTNGGTTTNYYCAGLAPDDGSGDPAIIGGSLLRSQITIFDRNANRIGFAPQTGCTL